MSVEFTLKSENEYAEDFWFIFDKLPKGFTETEFITAAFTYRPDFINLLIKAGARLIISQMIEMGTLTRVKKRN